MHNHITRDDRVCLAMLLRQGLSLPAIAKELGFHRTTILRELRRNGTDGHYDARSAHKRARTRRKDSKSHLRVIDTNTSLRNFTVNHLKEDWSPEQIGGMSDLVSFMTIYRFLGRHPHLKKYLRRQGKKRRKYGSRGTPSRYQANKRSIHDRTTSNTVGHWEGDTIVGKERKLRIITHVDKHSGFLVAQLSDATANSVYVHTKNVLRKLPCSTITYDNGSEFALHRMIERVTGSLVYFADPGSPHQRGANENCNGLLRQYFPKGSSFATITNTDVQKAVRKINSRPRKRLNYLTPLQVFEGVHLRC